MKGLLLAGLGGLCLLASFSFSEELRAYANLINTKGEEVGKAEFTETVSGVLIKIEASGLPPNAELALHIHELGKCDPPDFMSAKGHFNPYNKKHGFLNPEGPHAGDMPNVFTDEKGRLKAHVLNTFVTLQKGKVNSLLKDGGTSIMIHAHKDDYKSDPAGQAGHRIVCGVIR